MTDAMQVKEALKEAISQLIPFAEDGDQPAITAAIENGRKALAAPSPAALDPLADLVARFSAALLEKLNAAHAKGRRGWERDDWKADCQRNLNQHLAKGDPLDAAAYSAFLWHHGWPTIGPLTPEDVANVAKLKAAAALDPVTVERTAADIIHKARKVYEDHKGDGAWIEMERTYFKLIVALLSHPAPTGNAPEPVAWRWEWKNRRHRDGWTYTEEPPQHPDLQFIEPLYATPASNPQEAVLRTCATCHAILADGPQPAATYASPVASTKRADDFRGEQ
jgi:hypothetical protein